MSSESESESELTNDLFVDAFAIVLGDPQTIDNTGFTKESGEPDISENPGGASAWWEFTAPSSGTFRVFTTGSEIDTLLAVYTGEAVNALTLVASNDDDPDGSEGALSSSVAFEGELGLTYKITVDGFDGAEGSITIQIDKLPPPPVQCVVVIGG